MQKHRMPTPVLPRRGVPRSAAAQAARAAQAASTDKKASSNKSSNKSSAQRSSAERFRRKVATRHTRIREIHSGLVKTGRDAHTQLVEFARLERKGETATAAADASDEKAPPVVEAELLDDADTLLDPKDSDADTQGFDLDEE